MFDPRVVVFAYDEDGEGVGKAMVQLRSAPRDAIPRTHTHDFIFVGICSFEVVWRRAGSVGEEAAHSGGPAHGQERVDRGRRVVKQLLNG